MWMKRTGECSGQFTNVFHRGAPDDYKRVPLIFVLNEGGGRYTFKPVHACEASWRPTMLGGGVGSYRKRL